MRYMLLIYGDEETWSDGTPESRDREMAAHIAYSEALTAEGLLRGGEELQPSSSATTVRVRDGETVLTDGPFAETREQFGGFYVIECDTREQAIDAARRMPGVDVGSIEVRPLMEYEV